MKIKITKIDKRHTGNEYFTHKVIPMWQPGWTSIELSDTYRLMRQWCWETFGPSCDYEEYLKLARHRELNQRWS